MKKLKILCALFFSTSVFAASVVNLSIEPMKAIESRNEGESYLRGKDRNWQCLFNGQYGWMLNENIVLGPSVGFSWNIDKERNSEPLPVIVDTPPAEIISKERMIMIPISAFLLIDPIPQYMFHPIAQFSIGYNQAIISNVFYKEDSEGTGDPTNAQEIAKKYDGYYSGVYIKFSFDCMIDLGKQISVFAGPQWQISTMERRGKDDARYEYKFNAFGLRIGVSALL